MRVLAVLLVIFSAAFLFLSLVQIAVTDGVLTFAWILGAAFFSFLLWGGVTSIEGLSFYDSDWFF